MGDTEIKGPADVVLVDATLPRSGRASIPEATLKRWVAKRVCGWGGKFGA
jgi:hypothetical protein